MLVSVVVVMVPVADAAASGWAIHVAPVNAASAHAGTAPSAPASATATCSVLQPTVVVTWSAAPGVTTYDVFESTASASGPFTKLAGPVTGTSFTTPALAANNYWFAVESQIGAAWVSTLSPTTAESTIAVSLICIQP